MQDSHSLFRVKGKSITRSVFLVRVTSVPGAGKKYEYGNEMNKPIHRGSRDIMYSIEEGKARFSKIGVSRHGFLTCQHIRYCLETKLN